MFIDFRDIESCLTAFSNKVYRSDIKQPGPRSTLGDANEKRDWVIYAEFVQFLILEARRLLQTGQ